MSGPSRENASAGRGLVEPADGRGDLRLGVAGRVARGLRRTRAPPRAACPSRCSATPYRSLPLDRPLPRRARSRSSCCGGVRPSSSLGSGAVVHEDAEVLRVLGMEEVARRRPRRPCPAPRPRLRARRPARPGRPAQKSATPRLSCTTASCAWRPARRFIRSTVPSGQDANACPTRPSSGVDARERPAAPAHACPPRRAARRGAARRPAGRRAHRARTSAAARPSGPAARRGALDGRSHATTPTTTPRDDCGRGGDGDDPGERRHGATVAAAADGSPGNRSRRVPYRSERTARRRPRGRAASRYIRESNGDLPGAPGRRRATRSTRSRRPRHARCSTATAATLRSSSTSAPRDEWDEGHLPGALHLPRNNLESRVEALDPRQVDASSSSTAQSGTRSAFATKTLHELGYENVGQPRGRLRRLEAERLRLRDTPAALTPAQRRALRAPPPDPRGRRGGPAAAARVARPPDRRRRPRLARVALPRRRGRRDDRDHRPRRRRRLEPPAADRPLDRAARRAEGRLREADDRGAQPGRHASCRSRSGSTRRTSSAILAHGWDVIVDGTDNFPTRYLVNDASVWHGIPVVHGSIYRFEGQVTVFHPGERARATAASIPSPAAARARAELRRGRRARRPARASSARCRRARRSSSCSAPARRSPAGCCSSTRSTRPSTRSRSAGTPSARSAATTRRSPSTSTTSSSAPAAPGAHA